MVWTGYKTSLATHKVEMEGKASLPDIFHGVHEMWTSEDQGDAGLPSLKAQDSPRS